MINKDLDCFINLTINLSRMKKNLKLVKSSKENGKDVVSKPLPPGTLYVVCLNRPLIELWALNNQITNDYYDSPEPKQTSFYATSISRDNDNVPFMLSPEDELLLYNEGLSENY